MSRNFQQRGRQQRQSRDNENSFIEELTNRIKNSSKLVEVLDPKEFASPGGDAEKVVKELKGKLKTSQLRKIFDELKNVVEKLANNPSDEAEKTKLYLIYPKLAYSQGRGLMPKNFYNLITECLKKLEDSNDKEDFKRFMEFFTSIVAYNKFYNRNA